MFSLLSTWVTTISLIFGGCCSNAITLEQLTSEYPNAGSVLTLLQFLVISLHGLPKFLVWTRFGPRFRPRRVPITHYFVQVALFYLISLLNNAAFAYRIPMAVHIIFRSGGLIISLLLGWLISGKRYTVMQVLSVLLVTMGVVITTLSAQSSSARSATPVDPYTYASGIGILTLALVLSGILGLIQDWTYSKHGRPSLSSKATGDLAPEGPAPWQESMFYLHFLALPMFLPLLPDLAVQMHKLNMTGPRAEFSLPITNVFGTAFPVNTVSLPHLPIHLFRQSQNMSLLSITQSPLDAIAETPNQILFSLSIPHIYLPLILNTITQLFCVAGVHRLTTRVSALTVTLVLVVRKAASLIISVVGVSEVGRVIHGFILHSLDQLFAAAGIPIIKGEWYSSANTILASIGAALVGTRTTKPPQLVDNTLMWSGATMVLLGTIGYTIGSRTREAKAAPQPGKNKGKME